MLQPGSGSRKMEPSLHQKQGINHLNKVLAYSKFVAEAGRAVVHLTSEDWHVVADTLFHLETPAELLPEVILDFRLERENTVIQLDTPGLVIDVERI